MDAADIAIRNAPFESVASEPPLTVGGAVLPSRYCLSPLAGYTQLPFRRALRELGGLGLATTDLVHATQLLAGNRQSTELIATTVASVRQIPIIGNGDVRTVDDALQMRRVTGCHAVAIGRGALLDPWLFRKLADVHHGRPPREPTRDEQIEFLVRHYRLMTEQHSGRGALLFRKFAGWYGARLGIPEDLEQRLRQFETDAEFDEIVAQVRVRHGERRTKTATALLKTPNGPVERW